MSLTWNKKKRKSKTVALGPGVRNHNHYLVGTVLVKLSVQALADVCAHPSPPLATTPDAEEQHHWCLWWVCPSGPKKNNTILKIRFGFDLVANAFKSFAHQKYFRTVLATDTKVVK